MLWKHSIILFGGTVSAFFLIQSGIGLSYRYELSVLGLVIAGWSVLVRLGLNIWKKGGPRELFWYVAKVALIFVIGNLLDVLAILNRAWHFDARFYISLDFLTILVGNPVSIPAFEMAGFNVAVIGVAIYLLELLNLKKWL